MAVWLGSVSFGIVLWHEAFAYRYLEWVDDPVRIVVLLVVTVLLSLITGELSVGSWSVRVDGSRIRRES